MNLFDWFRGYRRFWKTIRGLQAQIDHSQGELASLRRMVSKMDSEGEDRRMDQTEDLMRLADSEGARAESSRRGERPIVDGVSEGGGPVESAGGTTEADQAELPSSPAETSFVSHEGDGVSDGSGDVTEAGPEEEGSPGAIDGSSELPSGGTDRMGSEGANGASEEQVRTPKPGGAGDGLTSLSTDGPGTGSPSDHPESVPEDQRPETITLWAQEDEAPPVPQSAQGIWQDSVQRYLDQKEYFEREGFISAQERLEEARTSFALWRLYLVNLWEMWSNDIRDAFRDILEEPEYSLIQDEKFLFLPLNDQNREEATARLLEFAEKIKALPASGEDWLSGLPRIGIRRRTESDYRLDDTEVPESSVTLLREATGTLILILKKLERSRISLGDLLSEALSRNQLVLASLQGFDGEKVLMNALLEEGGQGEELRPAEDSLKEVLQGNEKIVREAEDAAEHLQRKYFDFLSGFLIDIVNDLHTARAHFLETVLASEESGRQFLQQWGTLYDRLIVHLTGKVMEEALHLQPIVCKRGDPFDHSVHAPIISEPDAELENDQIKEITKLGFCWNGDQNVRQIVRHTEVIVVKNSP